MAANSSPTATSFASPNLRSDSPPPTNDDDLHHRSKAMSKQLWNNQYECTSCLETIRQTVATWACTHCYHIFHLYCIKKWSQAEESGQGKSFRCPHCQTPHRAANKYLCFCTKTMDPPYDPMITPHSCGETCGRRRGAGCPHPCPNQCHPGPCPECPATAPEKKCPCGKSTYSYRCGKPDPMTTCESTCGKMLSCGKDRCQRECHHGDCGKCEKTELVDCLSGHKKVEVECGGASRSCGGACKETQRCGEHKCTLECHAGACPPCDTDPSITFTCPCGKMDLIEKRAKCTDPIPLCGDVCGKVLPCGSHYCVEMCHEGPCPQCTSKTQARCRCGSSTAKLYCADIPDFTCHKRCGTKLSCGKHDCAAVCCEAKNQSGSALHQCTRTCNRKLPCGHVCTDVCHKGPCPPCINIVTHALSCKCGIEVLIPPQPCGTQPPECKRPCRQIPECGHEPLPHNCHYGDCPPCAHLVDKTCAGGHTVMSNIQCHAKDVSCGKPCEKPLPCGHRCKRKCHAGDCQPVGDKKHLCQQQCGKILDDCGHACRQKCHAGKKCLQCTAPVELICDCGVKKQQIPCTQYRQRLAKVDGDAEKLCLPCDDDCVYTRRLDALASISGQKASSAAAASKQRTMFSIKMWHIAKKSLEHVEGVERHFADFLESNEPSVMLPVMHRERRMIVHELALFYHIHCESIDQEPKRTCFLTKTMRTAAPSPLLSQAIKSYKNDPEDYAIEILRDTAESPQRVIVFEGSHINDISVHSFLKPMCGQFVVISAHHDVSALMLPPDPLSEKFSVYFAVFLSRPQATNGYSHLRRHGCPCGYHRLGEKPPPKTFLWEERTASSKATSAKPKAQAAAKKAHADPSTSSGGGGGGSWAQLIKQKEGSNAKTRQAEKQGKVEVGNKFAALKRK